MALSQVPDPNIVGGVGSFVPGLLDQEIEGGQQVLDQHSAQPVTSDDPVSTWINKYYNEGGLYGALISMHDKAIYDQIRAAIAKGDWMAVQGLIGNLDYFRPDAEVMKYIDNMIALQNTQQNQNWEQTMRDTSLLSSGFQLEQLGLSAGGVLQTGGSNVNGVSTARNSMENLAQQNKLAQYNQKMAMARQILGMTSSMASAGIYGKAIGHAKKAASVITSNAAHSGYKALEASNKPTMSWDEMIEELSK